MGVSLSQTLRVEVAAAITTTLLSREAPLLGAVLLSAALGSLSLIVLLYPFFTPFLSPSPEFDCSESLDAAKEAGLSTTPRLKLGAQVDVPQHSGPDTDSEKIHGPHECAFTLCTK